MLGWFGAAICGGALLLLALVGDALKFLPDVGLDSRFTTFSFILAVSAIAAAMGLMTPQWSASRHVARWSSSLLAIAVVVLNLDLLAGASLRPLPPGSVVSVDQAGRTDDLASVLKPSFTEVPQFVPWEDFDERVRRMERQAPPVPRVQDGQPITQ